MLKNHAWKKTAEESGRKKQLLKITREQKKQWKH